MTEHELKIHPQFLSRIASGQKTFEIRKNDRDYQVGDTLILMEYDPERGFPDHGSYDVLAAKITYMTTYEQKDDFCVLGIEIESKNPYGKKGSISFPLDEIQLWGFNNGYTFVETECNDIRDVVIDELKRKNVIVPFTGDKSEFLNEIDFAVECLNAAVGFGKRYGNDALSSNAEIAVKYIQKIKETIK